MGSVWQRKSGKNGQTGNDTFMGGPTEAGVACIAVMNGNACCDKIHAGSSPTLPNDLVSTVH